MTNGETRELINTCLDKLWNIKKVDLKLLDSYPIKEQKGIYVIEYNPNVHFGEATLIGLCRNFELNLYKARQITTTKEKIDLGQYIIKQSWDIIKEFNKELLENSMDPYKTRNLVKTILLD